MDFKIYNNIDLNKPWFEKTYFECDCMSHSICFFHDLETNEISLDVTFESYDSFLKRALYSLRYILFKTEIKFEDVWNLNRWQSKQFMEYLKTNCTTYVSNNDLKNYIKLQYTPKSNILSTNLSIFIELEDIDEYILIFEQDPDIDSLSIALKLNGKKTLFERIKRSWNFMFSHELRESKYGHNIPFSLTQNELYCIKVILSELLEIDQIQPDLPNINA